MILLLLFSANVFGINFEYNTLKSFPEDMPSREGYSILKKKFEKGTLAPTSAIFESKSTINDENLVQLQNILEEQELVSSVRLSNIAENEQVIQFEITFAEDPYDVATMDGLESMMKNSNKIISQANIKGEFYFAGETASSVDNRNVNKRDLIVIVIVETILIFAMLITIKSRLFTFRLSTEDAVSP